MACGSWGLLFYYFSGINQRKWICWSKHWLNNFHCVECHFIFTCTIIWTCINLSLFKLHLKFMIVMYFILFYLNLWLNICFLNNFANTRGYPWIPVNMKKIGGYPHNGYPTNIGMGTGQIFIQRVGYEGTSTHTLPARWHP